MPVLYDPNGTYQSAMGISSNHWHIIMGSENEIVYKQQYDDSQFQSYISQELAR